MADCKRNNCNKRIYRNTPAGRERLCEVHYQIWCRNQRHALIKKKRKCNYCGGSLANSRNKKYCCIRHRQLASRKLRSNLLTHSYWYHGEKMVARSPLELGSFTTISDVADLIKLQNIKSRHQRSFTFNREKLIPLLKLELSHRYPVSKGGMNTALNIIISPGLINRLIGNSIPEQKNGFPGIKASGESIPLKGSLYDSLIERFGLQEVNQELESINLKWFSGNAPRPINFSGMAYSLPLFTLFVEELYRLGYQELAEMLMSLKRTYERLLPFLLELIAALGFYAILTGDRKRFLARLCRFYDWFLSEFPLVRHSFRRGGKESFERILALMLNKYLLSFFAVDNSDPDAVIEFYNKFFSLDVLARGEPGEIIVYYWQLGKKYQSFTPFITCSPLQFQSSE